MQTANELRLGNCITYDELKYLVYEIHKDKLLLLETEDDSNGIFVSYKDIDVIKITQEILLKVCEFKLEHKYSYSHTNEVCKIQYDAELKFCYLHPIFNDIVNEYEWIYITSIEYLPQLQNLFFLLNNEELIINIY